MNNILQKVLDLTTALPMPMKVVRPAQVSFSKLYPKGYRWK